MARTGTDTLTAPQSEISAKTSIIPVIKLAVAPILWGGALTAGRIISAELPALTLTCIRFFLASLLLMPALYLKEGKFPKITGSDLLRLLLLSLVGIVVFNYLLFTSLKTITAIRSSVMLAFTPSLVSIWAFFVLKESFSGKNIVGIVLAAAGAIITVTNGDLRGVVRDGLSFGDLLMMGAVVSWGAYFLLIRQFLRHFAPLTMLAYTSLLGAVLLIPLSLAEGGWQSVFHLTMPAWVSILYLGFGAAGIAHLLYYQGIHATGSSRATIFLNLEPIAAIATGMIILDEQLTLLIGIGTILVISGLYLTQSGTAAVRRDAEQSQNGGRSV